MRGLWASPPCAAHTPHKDCRGSSLSMRSPLPVPRRSGAALTMGSCVLGRRWPYVIGNFRKPQETGLSNVRGSEEMQAGPSPHNTLAAHILGGPRPRSQVRSWPRHFSGSPCPPLLGRFGSSPASLAPQGHCLRISGPPTLHHPTPTLLPAATFVPSPRLPAAFEHRTRIPPTASRSPWPLLAPFCYSPATLDGEPSWIHEHRGHAPAGGILGSRLPTHGNACRTSESTQGNPVAGQWGEGRPQRGGQATRARS